MMVEAPAHNADNATPTKIMLSGVASPMRENSNTTTLDTIAPANAHRAMAVMPISDDDPKTVGTIIRMATVAPNAAPWEMPTVEAEARGFSSTLCSAAPASARPAPDTIAHAVRGSLMDCTVFTSCADPMPNRARTLSIGSIESAPIDSSMTATARQTATMATMQKT